MRIRLTEEGPEVSRIVSGMMRLREWDLDSRELSGFIGRCVGLGVTTFDHADIYGDYSCERIFGDALRETPSLRDSIEIVTKCGIMLVSENNPGCRVKHYDTSRGHIVSSVENSLRRLGTDRIDILLIHRPDPLMDIGEVASTFDSLHRSGKVLHFGVSNFTPVQYDLLASAMSRPLVTNQIQASVLHLDPLEDGTLDHCISRGIAPMAWSPLGGGGLFDGSDRAARLLKVLGERPDMMALAWLLGHPSRIVPVLGTGRVERIERAVSALDIRLDREEWTGIWAASRGGPVP
ncbi:MAG TPA: aldo/keto reductase [Candidatus Krumholzibacterium sp.]|nr:aldo/keto reductase [Candidatus Krumholzibacterium sp.]